jgi:hypothetical protein
MALDCNTITMNIDVIDEESRSDSSFHSVSEINSNSKQDGVYQAHDNYNESNTNKYNNTNKSNVSPSTRQQQSYKLLWTVLYCILGCLSLLIIGTVIFVAVRFTSNKRTRTTSSNNNDGLSEQQQILSNVISSIVVDTETLMNSSSPQYQAREWMLYNDTYKWNLNGDHNKKQHEHIVQRYILMVFYYATSGDSNDWIKNNWVNGYHECSRHNGSGWIGLNCNADDQVQTLWLGMYRIFRNVQQQQAHTIATELLILT